jgi:signal transduction histidine kinase
MESRKAGSAHLTSEDMAQSTNWKQQMERQKHTSTFNDRTRELRRHFPPPSAAVVLAVILFAAISVVFAHHVTLWLEAHPFKDFPDASQLQLKLFGYIAQDGVVITLFVILSWIAKGYTKPFFILWLFGWLSWIFMYSLRVYPLMLPNVHAGHPFHPDYIDLASDVFNGLHSYFFLVAGIVLIAPNRLSTSIAWQYPDRTTATRPFVGPPLWLFHYFWLNPIVAIPLIPLLAPYLLFLFERAARISESHLFNYSFAESISSIVALTILAWGLHRRFSKISTPAALAAVAVHVLYIEPQLAKIIYGDSAFSTKGLGYVFDVLAPTIIFKPALALFVAFLALRDIDKKREDVLETLETLTAGISHQIGTRVQRMAQNIQRLQRSPMVQPDALDKLLTEAFGMDELLKSMLALQRDQTPSVQDRIIDPVVAECVSLIRERYSPHRITVTTTGEPGIAAHFDPRCLQQALTNLLCNAVEAVGPCGNIEVEQGRRGGRAFVKVHDSGPGLSQDQLNHLFKRWYSTKSHGSGIGLAIARELVEMMGGSLYYESGLGATFIIEIPSERDR